ncbi:MAG: hypothetical protein OXT09_29705, partial [Myxococcales bacterium]|nr:hypothetical protein [Myxococcales bacterium]
PRFTVAAMEPPDSPAIARIERGLGAPGLARRLAHDLRRTDLATLLLDVFARRIRTLTPTALLERYRSDAFVEPAPGDPLARLDFERAAFAAAAAFVPLDLSPLAPLGACSTVAPVSPNLVEHTTRGREVVSDPSNVLALEAAHRRAAAITRDGKRAAPVALCTSHRVVRTPPAQGPGLLQHFRIFALLSSGRARAGIDFELDALRAHLQVHLALLRHVGIPHARLTLHDRSGRHADALAAHVIEPLASDHALSAHVQADRDGAHSYYPGLSFSLDHGETGQNLADGGGVDWTAQLLANRRERCIISGCGVDRLLTESPSST